MKKIVINVCYGGFSLSKKVFKELGVEWDGWGYIGFSRDDEELIRAIEKVGVVESSGKFAELKIIEIPDDVEWEIDDYDGIEHVAEVHRTWG